MLTKLLVIGCGGFLGAILRYGLSLAAHRRFPGSFAIGTLAVNVLGCLAIGALLASVIERDALSHNARLFWGVGLLGSFTTFSTFGFETFEWLEKGQPRAALLNVTLNVLLGLAAVWVGRGLVRGF
ncbi:MAG: fluoride efflux transporter CrcB [Planctomycetota bacterium]|nr:fluoride efflux transporter CrcB [Planctomycetota bacterium]